MRLVRGVTSSGKGDFTLIEVRAKEKGALQSSGDTKVSTACLEDTEM